MQNVWIWIVAIVLILAGGFIWWQSTQAPADVSLQPTDSVPTTTSDTSVASTTPTSSDDTSTAAPSSVTITYSSTGFSPAQVTVKKGGTVTWKQENGSSMWVATGPHPAHTGYDSTSRSAHCAPGYSGATPFDQCKSGSSYSFTFDQVGTWPYHDHMNATNFGKVTVVE